MGTLNAATIFDDNLSPPTAKANPFTADGTSGFWHFYAANGRYDVRHSDGGIPTPYTEGDYLLQDLLWVRELRSGLYLGGDLVNGLKSAVAVAVLSPNRVELDGDQVPNTIEVACTLRSEAAGTSLTPRLRNLTDVVTAGTGAATASTTDAFQTFSATLAAGVKEYQLQVTPSNNTNFVFGLGYIRFYET